MPRSRKTGSTIERFFLAVLVLGIAPVVGASRAAAPTPPEPGFTGDLGFAVRYRGITARDRVASLSVLPGESVTFEVTEQAAGSGLVPNASSGRLTDLGDGLWKWTAPDKPGVYPIHVAAQGDSLTLQAFVLVPYTHLKGDYLNGYRIGRYPEKPLKGLAEYLPPAGFVEVTRENENMLVSPHFRLKQFLCKQASGYPKYVVLNERLLLALENAIGVVNDAGYRATTFHVMSGYRTPAYNRSLGNVRYSQHQWGSAADIFIDEDGDGTMDDLNGDGRSDIADSELVYRLIDDAARRQGTDGLVGGLGKYRPTAAHGPFVHLDVREGNARW